MENAIRNIKELFENGGYPALKSGKKITGERRR